MGLRAAIIIPHYNDVTRLLRCLAALVPQLVLQAELVVIDNGSTDSLDPVRAVYPSLRIVTEPLQGAANARNRGVAETSAPGLFFLDCDCIPAPDWLETALRVAGLADLVGGEIVVFDETPPPRTGAQAFEAVFAFDNRDYVETKGFSVTANLLTRRDVFVATGPFVAGLSEDLDWCHRATAKGYGLIYALDLRVCHPSRGDWTALARKWRRMTQESYGLNGSGPLARLKWAFRALAMPLSILAHTPKVLTSPRLSGPRDRRSALGTLTRIRLQRALWMLGQVVSRT
jgi:GT2 family glycosyltransferase